MRRTDGLTWSPCRRRASGETGGGIPREWLVFPPNPPRPAAPRLFRVLTGAAVATGAITTWVPIASADTLPNALPRTRVVYLDTGPSYQTGFCGQVATTRLVVANADGTDAHIAYSSQGNPCYPISD